MNFVTKVKQIPCNFVRIQQTMMNFLKQIPLPKRPKSGQSAERIVSPDGSHLRLDDLTELDKIYLLLAENNLTDCFNVLCYDLQVRTIADWCKVDEEALKRFRLLPNFAKDKLRQLPQKVDQTDFVNLALKHGKLSYKAQLESSKVPLISVDGIRVLKKTASGPFSGSVCEAIWTKPDGEEIRVCLRYDRSEEQRNHFIHEAELSAPLNHENILHLYGVVLPGLYVDSVALVVDFAECGNIHESMPKQSVYSLIQIVTQLSSALEYLENKDLVHLSISAASIFVVKPGKVYRYKYQLGISYYFENSFHFQGYL